MATQAEVESYQSVIDGLSSVAFAQVKALLQSLDNPNPIKFRDALLLAYPELMAPFLSAAGDVAVQWYAELRASAGIGGAVRPFVVPAPAQGQLDANVRYALSPLFRPQEFIGSGILELLAGATQRMIANQGRDTIVGSAFSDRVRTGWARVPRPGCCAFCGLLASRGAVYRSAASAGGVVGRGVDASVTAGKRGGQGQGIKVRGKQDLQASYHDLCRCVAVPVFYDIDSPNNDYVKSIATKYGDLYSQAAEENAAGGRDLKLTLAEWRKIHQTN